MFNTKDYAIASTKVTHKYLLTNLVSMRIRQLNEGATPLVDPEDMKPIDIALKEIAEGLISYTEAVEETEETVEDSLFG
jgi:DNA-directed RNA polymerase omega subunit